MKTWSLAFSAVAPREIRRATALVALVLLARVAPAQTVTFDFDTATPSLNTYQNLPLDQTAGGATAHFSAVSGGFSVQTASSLGGLRLSLFSNRFLSPVNHSGSILEIQFSQWVTNISFPFATIQVQPIENETPIQLLAYSNTTAVLVGSTSATGVYGSGPAPGDSWPMGTLTFSSAAPFNFVRILVPTIVPAPPTGQATDFVLDQLTVGLAGGPTCTVTATASPAAGGSITGGGAYSDGLTARLVATPKLGYTFVNWTEGGNVVGTSPTLSLAATGSRTLVANFLPACTITTSASPTAGGITSGGGTYPSGSNVTLVATANPGYAFINWTQAGTPITNTPTYSFVASANRTLVANFTLIPQLRFTVLGPDSAALSWPAPSTGFVLQWCATLDTAPWELTTNAVNVVNGRNQVVITPLTGKCFYRLIRP